MDEELKQGWLSKFSNLFVLPDGRKISPLLILTPLFLVVGFFVWHLYQESLIRPTIVTHPATFSDRAGKLVEEKRGVLEDFAKYSLQKAPLANDTPNVYSIRVGQGHQMEFVHRSLSKLKKDNFNAFYQKVDDQYWVLVGRFSNPSDAESQLKSMTASGKYKGEVVTLSTADTLKP